MSQTDTIGKTGSQTGTRPPRQTLALAVLCTAVLIAQLDTSVVNLAVRPIGEYFRTTVAALQWVLDAYNLAYALLLLTGGLFADVYGRRRVFVAGAAIFTGASLLCSLAPDIAVLIGARALAGIGAAFLLPASLASIRVIWADPRSVAMRWVSGRRAMGLPSRLARPSGVS